MNPTNNQINQENQPSPSKVILKTAIIKTLPVFFGYLFLGIAFGVMLQRSGYNFVWAIISSVLIYAGTMQYMLVTLLGGGFSLFSIAVMTFTINSRHMFYGLSFLEKFKAMGKAYPYMIFALTDETYSLLYNTKADKPQDENKLFLFMALLNQSYWVLGATLGAILGELITFNSTGIDFAMTALFVVIFIDQWQLVKSHLPQLIGLATALVALLILGQTHFMLPAIATATLILLAIKNYLSPLITNTTDDTSTPKEDTPNA